LFLFPAGKGYFPINDQLSLRLSRDSNEPVATPMSEFRINLREGIKAHSILPAIDDPLFDGKHIDCYLMLDSETASLTKTGSRIFRKIFAKLVPGGYFAKDRLESFYLAARDSPPYFQWIFDSIFPDGQYSAESAFDLFDPERTGKFHFNKIIDHFLASMTHEDDFSKLIDGFTLRKVFKRPFDFKIPNFSSKASGLAVRPIAAGLEVSNMSSVEMELVSEHSDSRLDSRSSMRSNARKFIELAESVPEIGVYIRRKGDRTNSWLVRVNLISS
jgi:hypothetical protein